MYESYLYCVMLAGKRLPSNVAGELIKQADILFRDRKKQRKIKGDGFEGVLKTQRQTVLLSSIAGILFKSTIECEEGTIRVHFLVTANDLEEITSDGFDPATESLFTETALNHIKLRQKARDLDFPLPENLN